MTVVLFLGSHDVDDNENSYTILYYTGTRNVFIFCAVSFDFDVIILIYMHVTSIRRSKTVRKPINSKPSSRVRRAEPLLAQSKNVHCLARCSACVSQTHDIPWTIGIGCVISRAGLQYHSWYVHGICLK